MTDRRGDDSICRPAPSGHRLDASRRGLGRPHHHRGGRAQRDTRSRSLRLRARRPRRRCGSPAPDPRCPGARGACAGPGPEPGTADRRGDRHQPHPAARRGARGADLDMFGCCADRAGHEGWQVIVNAVPILLYHSVSADPADWIAPFAVSPATFRAHLDVVVASGLEPITVSQLADGLRGNRPLPVRPVLITADDGFADFSGNAVPALAERKLPSTLYVTTGALGKRDQRCVLPPADMLRAADLPGLEAAGVEIGPIPIRTASSTCCQRGRWPTSCCEAATCWARLWGIPSVASRTHTATGRRGCGGWSARQASTQRAPWATRFARSGITRCRSPGSWCGRGRTHLS